MEDELLHRFAATQAGLAAAAAVLADWLEVRGVPVRTIDQLELGLEELATNTIKYGFDDPRGRELWLRARLEPGVAVLVLEDEGGPFDPTRGPVPDLAAPLEERRIGGLGLHLLKNLLAGFGYRRVGDRNVVELRASR